MEIGNKILELRKKMKMSQEQLAEKLDVTRQTISNWELGETTPDIKQAKKLSQVFGVTIDQLTDNDVHDVLVKTVNNTEKLTNTASKISKIVGVQSISIFILLIVVLIGLVLVMMHLYVSYEEIFKTSVYETKTVYECKIKDEVYSFEFVTDSEKRLIDVTGPQEWFLEMGFNLKDFTTEAEAFAYIKEYVWEQGGTC